MKRIFGRVGGTQALGCSDQKAVRHAGDRVVSAHHLAREFQKVRSTGLEYWRHSFVAALAKRKAASDFTVKDTLVITEIFHLCVAPNQTPEPTARLRLAVAHL